MKMLSSIRAGLAPGLAGALTLLALGSTSASGAQVSYTSTLSIKPTGWTNTVSLPQFDPVLGTLLGVTLRVDSTFRSVSRVENTTPVPAPQTVSGALGSLVTYNPSALPLAAKTSLSTSVTTSAATSSPPTSPAASGMTSTPTASRTPRKPAFPGCPSRSSTSMASWSPAN